MKCMMFILCTLISILCFQTIRAASGASFTPNLSSSLHERVNDLFLDDILIDQPDECTSGFEISPITSDVATRYNCHKLDAVLHAIHYSDDPSVYILACFNPKRVFTYWTRHHLNPTGCPERRFHGDFEADGIDGLTKAAVANFYRAQNDQIPKGVDKWHRGHLTPPTDFDKMWQNALTYYYLNSAPQVAYFNLGPWQTLETAIRNWVYKNREKEQEVMVTTGILFPSDGTAFLDGADDKIPVPSSFWKIVYDTESGGGYGFIGHNKRLDEMADGVDYTEVTAENCQSFGELFTQEELTPEFLEYISCYTLDDFLQQYAYSILQPPYDLPLEPLETILL